MDRFTANVLLVTRNYWTLVFLILKINAQLLFTSVRDTEMLHAWYWNLLPRNIRISMLQTINSMATNSLARQGARASSIMLLSRYCDRNIPVSAQESLSHMSSKYLRYDFLENNINKTNYDPVKFASSYLEINSEIQLIHVQCPEFSSRQYSCFVMNVPFRIYTTRESKSISYMAVILFKNLIMFSWMERKCIICDLCGTLYNIFHTDNENVEKTLPQKHQPHVPGYFFMYTFAIKSTVWLYKANKNLIFQLQTDWYHLRCGRNNS